MEDCKFDELTKRFAALSPGVRLSSYWRPPRLVRCFP